MMKWFYRGYWVVNVWGERRVAIKLQFARVQQTTLKWRMAR